MSIAIISPYRLRGSDDIAQAGDTGVNWYTRRFAAALADIGADVHVVGPRAPGSDPSVWRDGAIEVLSVYRYGNLLVARDIVRGVKKKRTSIVHLQHELFAFGGISTALTIPVMLRVLRANGYKVVTTVHGVLSLQQVDSKFVRENAIAGPVAAVRTAWRALLSAICRASDVVHVNEPGQADLLRAQYAVKREVVVIPIGVENDNCRKETLDGSVRERLGIPSDAQVVLFFGYLAPYKGVDIFVDALRTALARNPRMHAIIAGAVPKRLTNVGAVEQDVARLVATTPRAHAIGFVPDSLVGAVYDAADVLVLPYRMSIAASGPMALALTNSLPILVSSAFRASYGSTPGMFELDHRELCSTIERFFGDQAFQRTVRQYWAAVREERQWYRVAKAFQEVYQGL